MKTKGRKRAATKHPPRERTSLMLSKNDYKLLDEVREANGWSVGEATSRAVHALFALDARLKSMGEQQEGEIRNVLERVRGEVDPALLFQLKPMAKVKTEGGSSGVQFGDLSFHAEDDRLFARREVGGEIEVYEVLDGRLVLRYPTPGPEIVLNQN